MEAKFTKGEWSLPHLASEDSTCNCGFVLNEQYCGAIATVHWSKDRTFEEGDNPPLEEAIANAKLISAAPKMYEALNDLVKYCQNNDNGAELKFALDILKSVTN